jgi:eukaryotic-like serine/threonine-protein kinase
VSGLAGQSVGAYRLISTIGHGGMGTVWLAERNDGRFLRKAAVKFLSVALVGQGGEERFQREGAILARLANPNIAELLDAGVSGSGQPYLILEYVEGERIDHYCDERKLDIRSRIRLFLDVLTAVAHAHANLIVHRDIKPSNVLVNKDDHVKLLDFGIAKLLKGEGQEGAATLLTQEGGSALTPEYAAPEQITGGPVTTETDVYGLGVLLYVLLTGQHPAGPEPRSPAELLRAIAEIDPPLPSEVAASDTERAQMDALSRGISADKLSRQLRGDLDTIIAKALKKNPRERYSSVTGMADDLGRYLRNEPIGARADTMAYRAAKFVRRNRTVVALAALVVVSTLAGLVGTLLQGRTARQQRDYARQQRDFAFGQVSRAEAINDLNAILLSDAAPLGKPFTVNHLLRRAEQIVGRQQGGNEVDRVELLTAIGRQYQIQDEDATASRILTEAYQRSRGLADRHARARAVCALASNLAQQRDPTRAEALFQEGLRELPDEPQFALVRVFCLERGSEVARDDNPEEAITRMQTALRILRQSPFDSSLEECKAQMELAESYRIAGRNREANVAFEQASSLLTALGRDDTQRAGTLFNNWGLSLWLLGRSLDAERVLRRAIDISRAGPSEEDVSPMLLINYGGVLRDLGRLDEAADYVERGYAKARQADNRVVIFQALLKKARILRDKGDLRGATTMLSEAEVIARRDYPPTNYRFAVFATEHALLAQARGNLTSALQHANQAMAIIEASIKAGGSGSEHLTLILRYRSDIERQLGGAEQAASDAARALNILQATSEPGTPSGNLGKTYLALGRALQTQGKADEAHTAFLLAADHLQKSLGPNHPDTRAALQLAESAAPRKTPEPSQAK